MIPEHAIRLGTINDLPFIKDSWRKAIKYIYPHQYELDFDKNYQLHMQKLIDNSIILVNHVKDDSNDILSYLIYTSFRGKMVIHFAYSVVDARNNGLVKELMTFASPEKIPVIFTHPAKNEQIMHKLSQSYIYDPTIIECLEFI
jgi:hypothetical protein